MNAKASKPTRKRLYTIDEWKAKFGEPGLAVDRNGRMMGYFSEDPDFCEAHPDDEPHPPVT